MSVVIDKPLADVWLGSGHDGWGWYYHEDEYPEEGCVGAFPTRDEAEKHAGEAGYALPARPAVARESKWNPVLP